MTNRSDYASFFDHRSFAVVGHEAKGSFPHLTYRGLKKLGKQVFPIDPSVDDVDGDTAYHDLAELPQSVEAIVLEVPREETKDWVARAAAAGITEVWIHLRRETPEALALAKEKGLNVRSGNCAVMYLDAGTNVHAVHRWIRQALGKY